MNQQATPVVLADKWVMPTVEQIKRNNADALLAVYTKYAASLYGFIKSFELTQQNSEYVLQSVFRKLPQEIDSFLPQQQQFFTWLYHLTKKEITLAQSAFYKP